MESEFSTDEQDTRSETTSIGDWANHPNATKEQEELVREESIAVRRTKYAVFLMIFLAGVGGTFVTYSMVKQSEYQDFSDDVSWKYSLIY
jgi:predicted MFS family arabinose efflux permease